jgi:hypothetical protein
MLGHTYKHIQGNLRIFFLKFHTIIYKCKLWCAKLQWLQDPSEINGDNPNNIRREASRYVGNKKREYLTDIINELASNCKNNNITHLYTGIN